MRDKLLYNRGLKFFGAWRAAVEAAGLDYDKVRYTSRRAYPDKASVIKAIQKRHQQGLPLNGSVVVKGKGCDPRLHRSGTDYFGSWEASIGAAGLSYKEVCNTRRYPNREAVLREVRRRAEAGLPVVGGEQGEHADHSLRGSGAEYFGSWRAVVEAAGLDYVALMAQRRCSYPSKESVIAEIQRRTDAGVPVTPVAVCKGEHADCGLHSCAQTWFGSWRDAVNAAGFDYARRKPKPPVCSFRKREALRFPDGEAVIAEIKNRLQVGLPLDVTSLLNGINWEPDRTLYHRGRKYFGSWAGAIAAAGLDYKDVSKKHSRRYPDKKAVVDGIKRRVEEGLPLNAASLVRGTGTQRECSLYDAGVKLFGRWEDAVSAAGISYETVCRSIVRYRDKASVVAEIQRRAGESMPLNARAVAKGPKRDSSLYTSGGKFFGSWKAALQAAGIENV